MGIWVRQRSATGEPRRLIARSAVELLTKRETIARQVRALAIAEAAFLPLNTQPALRATDSLCIESGNALRHEPPKPMIHKAKIPFDWDHPTNIANQAKHGVSLREASVLFTSGADYLEIFESAATKDRTLAIGVISLGLMLVVAIERSEDTVRIFSARWATPSEYQKYFKHIERRT